MMDKVVLIVDHVVIVTRLTITFDDVWHHVNYVKKLVILM